MDDETSEKRKAQFKALIDTAEFSNADVVSIAGRDNENNLLFVSIYAHGEAAAELEEFLKKRERREAREARAAKKKK